MPPTGLTAAIIVTYELTTLKVLMAERVHQALWRVKPGGTLKRIVGHVLLCHVGNGGGEVGGEGGSLGRN